MDAEVVGVKAAVGGVLGIEAAMECGEEDAGIGSGGGRLEPLEEGLESSVGRVPRSLTLLQEVFHRRHQRTPANLLLLLLGNSFCSLSLPLSQLQSKAEGNRER